MRRHRVAHGAQITFGEDIKCAAACEPIDLRPGDAAWLSSLISIEYKVEWYLDGLPAATPYRTTTQGRKLYEPGFRLGATDNVADEKAVRRWHTRIRVVPGKRGGPAHTHAHTHTHGVSTGSGAGRHTHTITG